MATPTRIYAVQSNDSFHLVEAVNAAAALRHITKARYEVSVANQQTLIAAIRDGVAIEAAVAEKAAEEAPATAEA